MRHKDQRRSAGKPEGLDCSGQNKKNTAQTQGEKQESKRQFLFRKLPVGYNGLHARHAVVKNAKNISLNVQA